MDTNSMDAGCTVTIKNVSILGHGLRSTHQFLIRKLDRIM